MKVRCAQTALKRTAIKKDAGDECRELILGRQGRERIFQVHQLPGRAAAHTVRRRTVNCVDDMTCSWPRIVDAVAAAHREATRIKRSVRETYSGPKVIGVNVREDSLAHVWHSRKVIRRNDVPCLHESRDRRAHRVTTRV